MVVSQISSSKLYFFIDCDSFVFDIEKGSFESGGYISLLEPATNWKVTLEKILDQEGRKSSQ